MNKHEENVHETHQHIELAHEGKKPFKCENCDHKVCQKVKLNQHITPVQIGKKPFKYESFVSRFEKFCHLKEHKVNIYEKT